MSYITFAPFYNTVLFHCTNLTRTTNTGITYAVGTDPVDTTSTGLVIATSTGLAPATTINTIKFSNSVILTDSLNSSVDQTKKFPV